jgi:predicted DNA repair protein MutK
MNAILSIEIIALTIASVAEAPIVTQVGVLILIGLMSTFAVYGIVSIILRMDDIGFLKKVITNTKTTPTKIDTITGVIKYSTNIDKSTGKP